MPPKSENNTIRMRIAAQAGEALPPNRPPSDPEPEFSGTPQSFVRRVPSNKSASRHECVSKYENR